MKVMVRVRPAQPGEVKEGQPRPVSVTSSGCVNVLSEGKRMEFKYDHALDETSSQADVFNLIGKPICDQALLGFNCTIFAYGQTGAGKTFTMQGPDMASSFYREQCGLVPRSMDYIFQRIQQLEEESCGAKKITARCSFLEIYMENVSDLLGKQDSQLCIREDAKKVCQHADDVLLIDAKIGCFRASTSRTSASSKSQILKKQMNCCASGKSAVILAARMSTKCRPDRTPCSR